MNIMKIKLLRKLRKRITITYRNGKYRVSVIPNGLSRFLIYTRIDVDNLNAAKYYYYAFMEKEAKEIFGFKHKKKIM